MSGLFDLTGKTAVVTGGSRGIGLMIARGLVQAGASVVVSSRKAGGCDEAVAELRAGVAAGQQIWACPADLSSEQECLRLADEVAGRTGRPARPRQQRGRQLGRAIARVPGVRLGQFWTWT